MTPGRAIIAIDGPAGAGKSTTARAVAGRLGFLHLDTGAMYRAIALRALRAGIPLSDADAVTMIAESARIEITPDGGNQRVLLDGEDVTREIRSPEVSRAVTPVSEISAVRRFMVDLQRKLAQVGGVVVEGRDIGTVVFPQADLKIYLDADLSERARRRLSDLRAAGIAAHLEEVERAIAERDRRDQTRPDSPLFMATDAIRVDTTGLTFVQQVDEIIRLFRAHAG